MSRIGKRPIAIPSGVKVQYAERLLNVKGPKGESDFRVPPQVEVEVDGAEIRVLADYAHDSDARCMMGTVQAVLQNMVTGVSVGFTRTLQLVGVGYRATVQGQNLELSLGFSHPVKMPLPKGVKAEVEGNTMIKLSSHDKVVLGQTAANIRVLRPPEPYQGKGILYQNERIRRKAGKAGKK
ncbi:MAG: 50S ribosomal protein L6 [Candidatus Lambdaproteobacteria bacterium]|nr:50S ribosomal protein L6 [Candidatus Lambdaproteobacteria bacterium]